MASVVGCVFDWERGGRVADGLGHGDEGGGGGWKCMNLGFYYFGVCYFCDWNFSSWARFRVFWLEVR